MIGLLKFIDGRLFYRDTYGRPFEPVPAEGDAARQQTAPSLNEVAARQRIAMLCETNDRLRQDNQALREQVKQLGGEVSSYLRVLRSLETTARAAATDNSKSLAKAARDTAFWKDVAARRKERCNYLAEEMRKYRDRPVEESVSLVKERLRQVGAASLADLVGQRNRALNSATFALKDSAETRGLLERAFKMLALYNVAPGLQQDIKAALKNNT